MPTTADRQKKAEPDSHSFADPGDRKISLLVVEDDENISTAISEYFSRAGYSVKTVEDGLAGIKAVLDEPPDAVVLDLMLPKMDGLAVCKELREKVSYLPILMLTAKDDVVDKVLGLEMGADDYLAKPFNPHELTARVAAILRRSRPATGSTGTGTAVADASAPVDEAPLSFESGRLVVDTTSRRFTLARPGSASPIDGRLTPGEIGLLAALARRPGAVLSRDQLLEVVTRRPDEVYDRVIDVHVANLRRKLGDDAAKPWLIETIPQTGYRLVATRDGA
jgi:DNA-binding response OmpR family regulator